MCSKLLCEFATQNNEQLIISYAEVHNLTNPKLAWSDMKNCENVYCMHSKDVHFISVDVPLTDINETIEAWLFDDENYPACNRLVRRLAKRTSKRKLYRKCKEKHKTWERYRNRIMEEFIFLMESTLLIFSFLYFITLIIFCVFVSIKYLGFERTY
jgi:hypothetical protein